MRCLPTVSEGLAAGSVQVKRDADGLSKSQRKKLARSRKPASMVRAAGDGSFVVMDAAGDTVATYRKRVLEDMLVQCYQLRPDDARRMCMCFGLDPRPAGGLRQASCPCPQDSGHASSDGRWHKFPKGFSFAVAERYEDFRQPGGR